MISKRAFSMAAAICLAQLPISTATAANRFSARDITPSGAAVCLVSGINAKGQVAGAFFLDSAYQVERGFVTGPNGLNPLVIGTLGGNKSGLWGINDLGQAVGTASTVNDSTYNAVLVQPNSTTPIDLGSLGGLSTGAQAINNKGLIVGSGQLADLTYRGFIIASNKSLAMTAMAPNTIPYGITQDGVVVGTVGTGSFITGPNGVGMNPLGSLGGNSTMAFGVNKYKEVVGISQSADLASFPAFVTDPGGTNMRSIGLPAVMSLGMGINNKGVIVGEYVNAWGDQSRAFYADRLGRYADLSSATFVGANRYLSSALGINDKGQIIATSNDRRCYLLTPVDR